MKKIDLPEFRDVECQCGEIFEAKRSGSIGYKPVFCEECRKKKIWGRNFSYKSIKK